MLIPDEISEIPLFNSKEDVYYYSYSYSYGDGATVGRTAVSYYSSLEKDKILEKYRLYFNKQKGTMNITKSGNVMIKFLEKKESLGIEIKNDSLGNRITIENFSE
jgi:hypothetical protein